MTNSNCLDSLSSITLMYPYSYLLQVDREQKLIQSYFQIDREKYQCYVSKKSQRTCRLWHYVNEAWISFHTSKRFSKIYKILSWIISNKFKWSSFLQIQRSVMFLLPTTSKLHKMVCQLPYLQACISFIRSYFWGGKDGLAFSSPFTDDGF